MNRKKGLFCALVMSAVAAQANAALMLEARREADPAPGLQRWIVSGTGDFAQGEAVVTVAKLKIDGLVHQVQPFERDFPPPEQTLDLSDLRVTSRWNADWNVLDTHYLVDLNASKQDPDIITLLGFLQETNDDSDPSGLNLIAGSPENTPAAGLGIFEMDSAGAFALQERLRGPSTDLLQVVLLKELGPVTVRAELFGNSDRSGAATIAEIVIPEPASASLLAGLGGVALLRRRR